MDLYMRRKGAIGARFGILYEVAQFLVTVCITISCDFAGQLGTEYAKHESKPLPAPSAGVEADE